MQALDMKINDIKQLKENLKTVLHWNISVFILKKLEKKKI